ncbi:hypothetical protein A3Q56_02403 [Intoshia linei]|uniref:Uncharacterized protein n=1 Tax=Intoshia linei TaxID=1819745 RepID=A0A177B8W3_9BILA|nr:hypothetical protein A3Q56_02403 [Intoshia linei]
MSVKSNDVDVLQSDTMLNSDNLISHVSESIDNPSNFNENDSEISAIFILSDPLCSESKCEQITQLTTVVNLWKSCHNLHVSAKFSSFLEVCLTKKRHEQNISLLRRGGRQVYWESLGSKLVILTNPSERTINKWLINLIKTDCHHILLSYCGQYACSSKGEWLLQDGLYSQENLIEILEKIYKTNQNLKEGTSFTFASSSMCYMEKIKKFFEKLDSKNLAYHQFNLNLKILNSNDCDNFKCNPHSKEPNNINKLCIRAYWKNYIDVNRITWEYQELLLTNHFAKFLDSLLDHTSITDLLQDSDVIGNIRFNSPTIYIFPSGNSNSAIFGISNFTLVLDIGYQRLPQCWNFIRHLDHVDSLFLSPINYSNFLSVNSILEKMRISNLNFQNSIITNIVYNRQKFQTKKECKTKNNVNRIDDKRKSQVVISKVRLNSKTEKPIKRSISVTPIKRSNIFDRVKNKNIKKDKITKKTKNDKMNEQKLKEPLNTKQSKEISVSLRDYSTLACSIDEYYLDNIYKELDKYTVHFSNKTDKDSINLYNRIGFGSLNIHKLDELPEKPDFSKPKKISIKPRIKKKDKPKHESDQFTLNTGILLVWIPGNKDSQIVRILIPGDMDGSTVYKRLNSIPNSDYLHYSNGVTEHVHSEPHNETLNCKSKEKTKIRTKSSSSVKLNKPGKLEITNNTKSRDREIKNRDINAPKKIKNNNSNAITIKDAKLKDEKLKFIRKQDKRIEKRASSSIRDLKTDKTTKSLKIAVKNTLNSDKPKIRHRTTSAYNLKSNKDKNAKLMKSKNEKLKNEKNKNDEKNHEQVKLKTKIKGIINETNSINELKKEDLKNKFLAIVNSDAETKFNYENSSKHSGNIDQKILTTNIEINNFNPVESKQNQSPIESIVTESQIEKHKNTNSNYKSITQNSEISSTKNQDQYVNDKNKEIDFEMGQKDEDNEKILNTENIKNNQYCDFNSINEMLNGQSGKSELNQNENDTKLELNKNCIKDVSLENTLNKDKTDLLNDLNGISNCKILSDSVENHLAQNFQENGIDRNGEKFPSEIPSILLENPIKSQDSPFLGLPLLKPKIVNYKSKTKNSTSPENTLTLEKCLKNLDCIYVDLTYLPNSNNGIVGDISKYVQIIRAKYYVISALEISTKLLDSMVEGIKTWNIEPNCNIKVTIIPTHYNAHVEQWNNNNSQLLKTCGINLSTSAEKCSIQMLHKNMSCFSKRIEF